MSASRLEQVPRDHEPLDLGRALVDAGRPHLAIQPFDDGAVLYAEPAVNLHGTIDYALRRFGRKQLRLRRFGADARLALVFDPRRAVDKQPSGVELTP